jgi:hypothetical protein
VFRFEFRLPEQRLGTSVASHPTTSSVLVPQTTFLATVKERFLAYRNLYALVRTEPQAKSVKQYGAKPLTFDTHNGAEVRDNVVNLEIAVVYFLIDASIPVAQGNFIKALGGAGRRSGRAIHLLQVRKIPLRFNTFLINDR